MGSIKRNMDGQNIYNHAEYYHAWMDTFESKLTAASWARSVRAFMAFLDRLEIDLLEESNLQDYVSPFILSRVSDGESTKNRHKYALRSFISFVEGEK